MSVSRSSDLLGLSAFVALCFGTAALGASAVASALPSFYLALAKPPWTPPAFVFGPVWTLLYALMAVAGWLAWRGGRLHPDRRRSWGGPLFLLQLALNLAWPWLFFAERRLDLSLGVVAALWIAIVGMIASFCRVDRAAAVLLLPYLLWVSLATALNLAIWRMNPTP